LAAYLIGIQPSSKAVKAKKLTVGAQFKNSLAELMAEMSVAQPHFIRCIKPTETKVMRARTDVTMCLN
jgi:myosin heavy subunit